MGYNERFPANEKCKDKKALVAFEYEEARSLANFLDDVHRELDSRAEEALNTLELETESIKTVYFCNERRITPDDIKRLCDAVQSVRDTSRLLAYPTNDVVDIHNSLFQRFINLMKSLEYDG